LLSATFCPAATRPVPNPNIIAFSPSSKCFYNFKIIRNFARQAGSPGKAFHSAQKVSAIRIFLHFFDDFFSESWETRESFMLIFDFRQI
jgi:hypothetical protein